MDGDLGERIYYIASGDLWLLGDSTVRLATFPDEAASAWPHTPVTCW